MNKKILYGISLITSMVVSTVLAGGPEYYGQSNYFTGFYVGGSIAVHSLTSDQQANLVSSANSLNNFIFTDGTITPSIVSNITFPSVDTDVGSLDIYGGARGGFNLVFAQHWLLGLEGFWEGGSQKATTNNPENTIIQGQTVNAFGDTVITNGSIVTNLTTIVRVKDDYGVAGRFGYVATPSTLIYGKVGAIWAKITSQASVSESVNTVTSTTTVFPPTITDTVTTVVNGNGSSSNQDTKIALLLGVGIEQFIYANMVSLSLEYNYANFGTISSVGSMSGNGTSTAVDGITGPATPMTLINTPLAFLSSSSRVKLSNILAGVNVYFGHNWL